MVTIGVGTVGFVEALNPWRKITTIGNRPKARSFSSSVIYNGDKMIIFGGKEGDVNGKQVVLNDVWELDLRNYEWNVIETSGTKPSKRHGGTAILYNEKQMFIFGGSTESYGKLNDVWMLNLTANEWSNIVCTGSVPPTLEFSSSVEYEGQMVIFGGDTGSKRENRVWALDLSNKEWTEISTSGNKPPGRAFHGLVLSKNKMVVFGGHSSGTNFNVT